MAAPKEPFQSEIRESQVNALLEKVQKKSYGKYLRTISLKRARGFVSQNVNFDFPVTALIGPNGGGKTTILGAAACAYKSIKPRQFFAKSGKFDNSMQDWTIEYELIDRKVNANDVVRRSASFKSQKWDRSVVDRQVTVFGIARTVAATERSELRKCASNSYSVPDGDIEVFDDAVAKAVEKILGKSIGGYSRVRVDKRGRVILLTGQTASAVKYSEFHFGAGESSVIRMAMKIESMEDNSLVLIEELENGLHPVATIRMVEYLIEVAERKKAQIIFTTHSNDALKPLPSQAIWASVNQKVFQGSLDINSLRAISGQVDARLAVFVEDTFAAEWVRGVLRTVQDIAMDAVQVHAMAGDGLAVDVNRFHNQDPSKAFPSICIIDGDSRQDAKADENVFRLPGASPESYVFDQVLECMHTYSGKLAVALHHEFEKADEIVQLLKLVKHTNRDPHLLFSQVGSRLGLISEAVVRGAFVSIWCQAYPKQATDILSGFASKLPIAKQASDNSETMKPKQGTLLS